MSPMIMGVHRHQEPTPPEPERRRTEAMSPIPAVIRPGMTRSWVTAVQRAAGNRAVAAALVQRAAPEPVPAGPAGAVPGQAEPATGTGGPEPGAPGREPRPDEVEYLRGLLPGLTEFRILREPAGHYNCFAWAIGIDDRIVGSRAGDGYSNDSVENWTDWLRNEHGFGRFFDGIDTSADLLLFGTPEWIQHAARKAESPYGTLTFSSKLGGGWMLSPVIQHAPWDLEGNQYGRIVRSLWRGPASAP